MFDFVIVVGIIIMYFFCGLCKLCIGHCAGNNPNIGGVWRCFLSSSRNWGLKILNKTLKLKSMITPTFILFLWGGI